MFSVFRFHALFLCMIVTMPLLGCGEQDDAVQRFQLSGTVSFEGNPVTHGQIIFTPDNSKGNRGPGAIATIVDGQYQTEEGKGIIAGPHRVQIVGFDGPPIAGVIPAEGEREPKLLFEGYETEVEFSREESTHDFSIPTQ